MLAQLGLLLLITIPHDAAVRDRCDLVEVNHLYDPISGQLTFTQVIWWDYYHDVSRYHVRAWRRMDRPGVRPWFSRSTGTWKSVWWDGDVLRQVEAEASVETWTQHDPELEDEDFIPKENRLGFSNGFAGSQKRTDSRPPRHWPLFGR